MWERHRDPNHGMVTDATTGRRMFKPVATRKLPLAERGGREAQCCALAVNAADLIEGASLETPCTFAAHHTGRHTWQS